MYLAVDSFMKRNDGRRFIVANDDYELKDVTVSTLLMEDAYILHGIDKEAKDGNEEVIL